MIVQVNQFPSTYHPLDFTERSRPLLSDSAFQPGPQLSRLRIFSRAPQSASHAHPASKVWNQFLLFFLGPPNSGRLVASMNS